LNASTVKKIASAGKIAPCGAVSISERAASSIAPHSGVGGCAPIPRNDRLAAVMIDVPMRNEK
jgi:ribosomal protein S12 methylthiotransferase